MRGRDNDGASQGRRTRKRVEARTPSPEPEAEEEENEDFIVGGGMQDCTVLQQEVGELQTSVQNLKARLEGLETFVKEQLVNVEQRLSQFAVRIPETVSVDQLSIASVTILGLYQESKTGLKKIVRESVRLWMFSEKGSMYAPISKAALAGIYF